MAYAPEEHLHLTPYNIHWSLWLRGSSGLEKGKRNSRGELSHGSKQMIYTHICMCGTFPTTMKTHI